MLEITKILPQIYSRGQPDSILVSSLAPPRNRQAALPRRGSLLRPSRSHMSCPHTFCSHGLARLGVLRDRSSASPLGNRAAAVLHCDRDALPEKEKN